jgi:hypothetical protein
MLKIAAELAARTVAPLASGGMSAAFAASIVQHEHNLASLATALLKEGCDEATVQASLSTMFESYRQQLTAVMTRLKEDADALRT